MRLDLTGRGCYLAHLSAYLGEEFFFGRRIHIENRCEERSQTELNNV